MKPRHARFLLAYQQHGNATRAAIEAGYAESNAAQAGSRLLKKPAIRAALDAAPPGTVPLVSLPSGVQLAFSYRGRPISPDLALTLAEAGPSGTERRIWAAGLGTLALLADEAAKLGNFGGPDPADSPTARP